MTDTPAPAPGWYPDPSGTPGLRWWDGATWTDHTHPGSALPATATALAPDADAGAGIAPTDRAVRRHWRPIALVLVLLVVALVAIAALAASLLRPKLNTATVERDIAQQIADELGVVTTVTCPDRVDLVKGGTFECAVATDDGRSATIRVTQIDDAGVVEWDTV